MKNRIGIVLSVITASTLMLGCGSSSATPNEPTEIAATQQANTQTESLPMDGNVTSGDITVTATTQDERSESTITVPAGTGFTDQAGNKLENVVPKVAVTQDKSSTSTTAEVTNKTQTKIELTDENVNSIVPTKPVDVKVKAPTGTKPGDEVRVSIPDDAGKVEKLVLFIVDAKGYISVRLYPNVFKKQTVILIVIEVAVPVTGGEGGN